MRLPELDHYLDTLGVLRAAKGWTESRDAYRIAALPLMPLGAPGEIPRLGQRVAEGARLLRKQLAWDEFLRSLTPVLAALSLSRGLEPSEFQPLWTAARAELRARSASGHRAHGGLAAAYLALGRPGTEPGAEEAELMQRFGDIWRAWRRGHRLACGMRSAPAAALHALGTLPPDESADRVEAAYGALRRRTELRKGPRTLRLAQMLALCELEANDAADRFDDQRVALEGCGFRRGAETRQQALALTTVPGEPRLLAEVAAELRDALRASRPRPSKAMAARLGPALVVHEALRRLDRPVDAQLGVLPLLQSILAAKEGEAGLAFAGVAGFGAT